MISSAWKNITGNFKEVVEITKPILVMSLIIVVLKFANIYLTNIGILHTSATLVSTALVSIISVIISVMVGLIYYPAAFRTFQKKEFNETTTFAENVAFAKTHKWEFVCVMFWNGLLSAIYMIGSLLPAIAGVLFAVMMKDTNLVVGILIGVACGIVTVYFLFKNISKFVFSLSVYFLMGEGKSYREPVKESMRLGTVYRADTYALFGILIVVALGLFIVEAIITGSFLLPEYIAIFSGKVDSATMAISTSTEWRVLISSLLTTVIDVLIALPLTAILTAKAFVAIKAKDDASRVTPVVDTTPVTPVVELVAEAI